jgi:hypothetical protein
MGDYIYDANDYGFINPRKEIIDGPFAGFERVICFIVIEKKA